MSLYESIFLSVFDLTFCIIISRKLLNGDKKIYFTMANIVCFSIIIGMGNYYIKEWYSVLFTQTLAIIMFYLQYRQKLIETLYLYVLSATIILIIQFMGLLPLNALFGNIEDTFEIAIIAQLINFIIIIIVIKLTPLHYFYNFASTKNRTLKYVLLNAYILMVFMLIYWNININGIIQNLISVITLSLFIVLINLRILGNGLENEKIINKLRANEQYLPIVDELISDIRERQHDFKNHIQALSMLIYESEDKNEIMKEFEKYMGEIAHKDELNEFLKYSNKIISGFLYSKKKQAEAMGIQFTVKIQDTSFKTKLVDYEWIEMLGILIDNAMETKVKNNKVIVIIDKEKDMNLLIVKNSHPYLEREMIKNMFNRGVSFKLNSNSNWGYGLNNLSKIIHNNKGTIDVFNETETENYVVFKVMVP